MFDQSVAQMYAIVKHAKEEGEEHHQHHKQKQQQTFTLFGA